MRQVDFLIVGAGIAGAGVAYRLAGHGSVLLVDMEEQAGYHTTGRSAAFYAETYGGPKLQPLTSASKDFLHAPPIGFTAAPLISDQGAIHIFTRAQEAVARQEFEASRKALPNIRWLSAEELADHAPHLARGRFAGGILDTECGALDVAALHQGYLKAARKMGAEISLGAAFDAAERTASGGWAVRLRREEISARVIVNAAGAWADTVAERAGIKPLGFEPLRRTLVTVPAPKQVAFSKNLPIVLDIEEDFYFKPEGDGFLLSPADETLSPPCDSQPELEDIALAVDHFEKATGSSVSRVEAKWSGLRTFSPDRAPVIGFEPGHDGFFWNAGQGGYGIQTSPAWSRYAAHLLLGQGMPDDLARFGAVAEWYSPARFRK